MHFIVALFCIAGLALGGRLFFLQVANHGFYKALAQGQRISASFAEGERGNIFMRDKNGELVLLATNQETPYAFVSPAEIEEREQTSKTLARILSLPESEVLQAVQKKDSLFELIKKKITEEEKSAILEADMKGMHVGFESLRYYPQGSFASQILGFVNQDGSGQYGVEEYENNLLSGKDGLQKNALNPAAQLVSALINTSQDGSDVILTIDYNVQSMAEALLEEAQDALAVKEGSIIVADPKTGAILALAELPSFNPNDYASISDFTLFQGGSVEKLFEPGSVFKAVTMASAIDEGAITPDTAYEDTGMLRIGGYKILNYDNRVWGERTMKEVLQFSINTGAVFAKEQLGNRKFMEYAEKFGLFRPTGIELAGEVYSQNKELKQGYEINLANASFGQGIEMTAVQLLRAYMAIANSGKMLDPRITEQETKEDFLQVISPQSALTTTSMLVSVIEEGYSKKAKIPGYYIAGKTGTAQIAWSALGVKKSGYSDQTVQSFVGYAPAYNPQFLILVKLNNPQAKTAEYSAMPLFKDLAKYLIDYLEIPPDYEVE